jgi:hypothetical protein
MNPDRNGQAPLAHEAGSPDDPLARLLRLVGPRDPVPADTLERVRLEAHAEWRRGVQQRARRALYLRSLAALGAAAALVMGFLWWLRPAAGPAPVVAVLQRTEGPVWLRQRAGAEDAAATPVSGGAITAGTWIETGATGRAALRLNGGASLRFDVSTRARLDSVTSLVLSRGAVYVDTGALHARSLLEVKTAFGVARDVGTQFELRLSEHALRLRVREGRVDLDCAGAVHAAGAGEELRLADGRALERGVFPAQGQDWSWTQAIAPAFAIEGRPLRAFLDWYARETRYLVDTSKVPVSVLGEAMLIHGTVEGLTPDEALRAVLPTCGLSHRLAGRTLIVEPLDDSPRHRARRE